MRKSRKKLYPPDTDDIDELARFFDSVDSTQLAGVVEVKDLPVHDPIEVSFVVPRGDVEYIERLAAEEDLPATTYMRWILRKFVRRLKIQEMRTEERRAARRAARRKAG